MIGAKDCTRIWSLAGGGILDIHRPKLARRHIGRNTQAVGLAAGQPLVLGRLVGLDIELGRGRHCRAEHREPGGAV
jgi:hypothetical protein